MVLDLDFPESVLNAFVRGVVGLRSALIIPGVLGASNISHGSLLSVMADPRLARNLRVG